MKYFLPIFASIIFLSCAKKNSNYEDKIRLFQYNLNSEFADASRSPLTEEDLKTFKNLDFFEINEDYKIEAKLELTPYSPVFQMKTTDERQPLYRKYGVLHFSIDGKNLELSVYQSQELMTDLNYKNYLFLPFNDLTNGKTSYGGGRFIDLEIPSNENNPIYIDFNKAYNPYCAYNHKYSCPIPPSENNLPIEISAGIKAFKKNH